MIRHMIAYNSLTPKARKCSAPTRNRTWNLLIKSEQAHDMTRHHPTRRAVLGLLVYEAFPKPFSPPQTSNESPDSFHGDP